MTDSKFVFVDKPKQCVPDKSTVAGNVVVAAKFELGDIANNNDVSLSEVVTQMVYFCLGRDQLTGNKIEESEDRVIEDISNTINKAELIKGKIDQLKHDTIQILQNDK